MFFLSSRWENAGKKCYGPAADQIFTPGSSSAASEIDTVIQYHDEPTSTT